MSEILPRKSFDNGGN